MSERKNGSEETGKAAGMSADGDTAAVSRNGDWPVGLDVDDMRDIIAGVSGSLTRQYREHVELDDVKQQLLEWSWKKREKVAEYLIRDEEKERKAGVSAFMRSLYREGSRYCRREKAAKSGYEVSDEYFYSTALVEDVLKVMANGGAGFNQPTVSEGRRSGGDPSEGGGLMALVADVSHALDQMEPDTRSILVSVLGLGVPAEKIAGELGVTPQAVRQRVQRACVRVVRELGGESPWR